MASSFKNTLILTKQLTDEKPWTLSKSKINQKEPQAHKEG